MTLQDIDSETMHRRCLVFLQCSVLKLIYWLTFNYLWFFSSGCYYFLFIHVAGALAEKGCSLDEVAGATQELADSIGMIYLIIHNVHCDCLAYMYIIVMVSVDHGWVYCQFIVAFSIIPLLFIFM